MTQCTVHRACRSRPTRGCGTASRVGGLTGTIEAFVRSVGPGAPSTDLVRQVQLAQQRRSRILQDASGVRNGIQFRTRTVLRRSPIRHEWRSLRYSRASCGGDLKVLRIRVIAMAALAFNPVASLHAATNPTFEQIAPAILAGSYKKIT